MYTGIKTLDEALGGI